MPDVDWNAALWSGEYDWKNSGEEWSATWGGSVSQWYGSIFPRIHRFLPASSLLEIAPGFGRWTRFLIGRTPHYLGIDLSAQCVAACEERFRADGHARFVKNDGISLEAAPDGRFDFVFSFDSLVHVEADVMETYIAQILRKLTVNGAAFLHHSNIAALSIETKNIHNRAVSVSGEVIADFIRAAGGKILVQERINWGGDDLNDCFTLFARREHPSAGDGIHLLNRRYMEEASIIHDTHAPYNSPGESPG